MAIERTNKTNKNIKMKWDGMPCILQFWLQCFGTQIQVWISIFLILSFCWLIFWSKDMQSLIRWLRQNPKHIFKELNVYFGAATDLVLLPTLMFDLWYLHGINIPTNPPSSYEQAGIATNGFDFKDEWLDIPEEWMNLLVKNISHWPFLYKSKRQ